MPFCRAKVLYDNIHLHFNLPESACDSELALGKSLSFACTTGEPDEKGRIRTEHRGLRIEYWPSKRWGRVRGSLHTFAQGSNVGVFRSEEVASACSDLASSMNLPPEVFMVRRLEAGVNLVVDSSPRPFLESLSHHKKSPFWPLSPPSGHLRPLEYLAVHADYKLKYYDKGAYATRQGTPLPMGCRHLLRYEVVFTRVRNLNQLTGRANLTLADLAAPDVLAAVACYLHQQWQTTIRHHPPDYSGLSLNDAFMLRSGAELALWEAVRPYTSKSTYKRRKARYRQLQKQAAERAGPHPYDLLLPEQLQVLIPGYSKWRGTKSGTVRHACNQVEIGLRNSKGYQRAITVSKTVENCLVSA